jgi:UDP-N-acetylglucosamine--N-acetylmuramyl-(pentapeptide) pyrophosphoryl-undecaprenol N-acetylglucosamine transferase
MKIVLTGGSTGGHFYPLIAVTERIHELVKERKLLEPKIYFVGPKPFDAVSLMEQDIEYRPSTAGKIRRKGIIRNFFDIFRTAWGIVKSLFQLFSIYPDVIFSKGSYAAFPTLFAARLLRIPVIIHESDATPGIVNKWSSSFAVWIGIAHPDAAKMFSPKVQHKIALVGNPIRKEIERPAEEGGHEFLKLDKTVPTIFVLGGSQGAETINNVILDALPNLIEKYNVVHQVGKNNLNVVNAIAKTTISNSRYDNRYRSFGLLNALAIKMIAGISDLIISRAGSGSIFEIASWGIPSILIPIPEDISHDQTKNAFSYARSGAAVVLKQRNVTQHILEAEIDRIISDTSMRQEMSASAKAFSQTGSASKIAKIILDTALEHAQ